MTGLRSRRKGQAGEREVAKWFNRAGWPEVGRNHSQSELGGSDLVGGPLGMRCEIKRTEQAKVWAWIEQARAACHAGDWWCVWFRRSNDDWRVLIDAERFMQLLVIEREWHDLNNRLGSGE